MSYVSPRGYRVISITQDGKRKQVPEHRYLMEQHLGRKLQPDEVVHHLNGNPTDNRIENMQVVKFDAHTVLHHIGAKRPDRSRKHMQILANYREENKRLRELNADLLAAAQDLVSDASKTNDPFPSVVVRQSKLAKLQAAIARAGSTSSPQAEKGQS